MYVVQSREAVAVLTCFSALFTYLPRRERTGNTLNYLGIRFRYFVIKLRAPSKGVRSAMDAGKT